jgi:hypothetical protein
MSIEDYQRAVGDLLRSPALCTEVRRAEANPEPGADPLGRYRLTARERSRLAAMSAHRGMVVNCTLYRASRLVGIARRLPATMDALGPALRPAFDAYLAVQPDAEPEFDREARQFADFLAAWPGLLPSARATVAAEAGQLPA